MYRCSNCLVCDHCRVATRIDGNQFYVCGKTGNIPSVEAQYKDCKNFKTACKQHK